jgi:hypothetical protein
MQVCHAVCDNFFQHRIAERYFLNNSGSVCVITFDRRALCNSSWGSVTKNPMTKLRTYDTKKCLDSSMEQDGFYIFSSRGLALSSGFKTYEAAEDAFRNYRGSQEIKLYQSGYLSSINYV